jgi:hypothetical protein
VMYCQVKQSGLHKVLLNETRIQKISLSNNIVVKCIIVQRGDNSNKIKEQFTNQWI